MVSTSDGVASRARVGTGTFLALIGAFVVSSLVWVLNDQWVWSFDPAFYGYWTLELSHAQGQGVARWFATMVNALGQMPPLLVWLGQFFVPLRKLTGEIESALAILNIVLAVATLALVYSLARRLGAGILGSLAAVIACAGAPLFLAFSHLYYTEMPQAFSVAVAMFVAWRAESRSLLRTLALSLLALALAFLSKASSGVFVLPMLTYVVTVLAITWKRPRPSSSLVDAAIFVAVLFVLAAALSWYVVNWRMMVEHVVEATTTGMALNYGSPVYLPRKLNYWISWLDRSISPLSLISIAVAALVILALGVSLVRSFRRPFSVWLNSLVDSRTLFGLALAGTVVVSILTYALQINEDSRFLTPVVPLVAALVGWSLAVYRSRVTAGATVAVLIFNAVLVHAYAFAVNPLQLTVHPWLLPLKQDRSEKNLLTDVVRTMCRRETAERMLILAVNYIPLNPNSASFYAQKQRQAVGHICNFGGISYTAPNLAHVLREVDAAAPAYVATVAPEKQLTADFANVFTRPFAEHLAKDPRFELIPGWGDYLLIYRNKQVVP